MKKKIIVALALVLVLTMSLTLVACDGTENHKVTFYDATDPDNLVELKTVEVKDGETAESYTPTKDGGYEFVNWFAVPSKNHKFDFTTKITEDTKIYAGFTKYVEDTRSFYVVGSGTSELLYTSNWGKVITDAHKLTKAADKNEYSITMDLKAGDQFQFAINTDWANKRGFGYLTELKMGETEVFSGKGSVYDDSAKGSNIEVKHSGNYTLTLKTYPSEDYYNTNGNGYTEERKEIYNIGLYDSIEWVRNGDVLKDSVTITNFYIKGAGITGWKDMYNASTQMTAEGDTHTLKVWLKEGDEFMFTSRVTKIENDKTDVAVGAEYIKADAVDDKTYISGDANNMTAKASGEYTFTYNATTKKMTVAFDGTKTLAEMDYYLDGDIGADGKWNEFVTSPEKYKLAETAENSGMFAITVDLKANRQIQVRACEKGATPKTDNTVTYQFAYLAANSSFSAVDADNNNIKVLKDGTYTISIDNYSKTIVIVEKVEDADPADTLDLYIKGVGFSVKGTNATWSHDWDKNWLMALSSDKLTYEITITVAANATAEFGIEKHPQGEKEGYGDYVGKAALGTKGDANGSFNPESGNNFKGSVAGTYKIVYEIATGKVDIYAVNE